MNTNEKDQSRISDDKIMAFVCEKVFDVAGVHGMGLNMSATALTKNLLKQDKKARGVRISFDDETGYTIDIYLIVVFGVNIPETAWNVQKNVFEGLKTVYDIEPENINIHIQGVHAG